MDHLFRRNPRVRRLDESLRLDLDDPDDGKLDSVGTHTTLGSTISNYGWYWLFLGVVLILAGFAVIGGSQLGRWIGIGAAAVGAIGTMAWMPYYPIWALTYFVIAILVMYGLAAHGGIEVPSRSLRSE